MITRRNIKGIRKAKRSLERNGLGESQEYLAEVGSAFADLYCDKCKNKVKLVMEQYGAFRGSLVLSNLVATDPNFICKSCKRKLQKKVNKQKK